MSPKPGGPTCQCINAPGPLQLFVTIGRDCVGVVGRKWGVRDEKQRYNEVAGADLHL